MRRLPMLPAQIPLPALLFATATPAQRTKSARDVPCAAKPVTLADSTNAPAESP